MPRDASDTRDRLLAAAEELFAARGVHQATTSEIVAAAGQRNVSALSYHFGSRAAVLNEILTRHGTPLDARRGALVTEPIEAEVTRALVAALVVPYAGCLEHRQGRHYVRIVVQLSDRFPGWPVEGDLNPPHLRRILTELERRSSTDPAVARARLLGVIMLLTTAVADRARILDESGPLELDHDRFVATLADMMVAALEAPVGPVLSPTPVAATDHHC